MANPVDVVCTAGQWTKVIDGEMSGLIVRRTNLPHYVITTRDAGGLVPAGSPGEGRSAFVGCETEGLDSTVARDVYIWVDGDVNGLVEVTV